MGDILVLVLNAQKKLLLLFVVLSLLLNFPLFQSEKVTGVTRLVLLTPSHPKLLVNVVPLPSDWSLLLVVLVLSLLELQRNCYNMLESKTSTLLPLDTPRLLETLQMRPSLRFQTLLHIL